MPTFPINGPDRTLVGPDGPLKIDFNPGRPTVLVGANGSGKTRLAAEIETVFANAVPTHRVAAHRALTLNPDVNQLSLEVAQNFLWYGGNVPNVGPHNRLAFRWQNQPATLLLSDFDALLQVLFAEDAQLSSAFRRQALDNRSIPVPVTSLDRLQAIWKKLLPHVALYLTPGSVRVDIPNTTNRYKGSELSDGERAIFYLLGQALVAPTGCVLIIDEPELHIHKAILSKLFDEIETARQDCALLYLTHDLDFAASRRAAQKFFVREYRHLPPSSWSIEPIPEDTGFPEAILTTVLGSRQPVLFVEGTTGSLDVAIYRQVYKDRTVIPVGSCEKVIEAAKAFGNQGRLHHIGSAGLIDMDERSNVEIESLKEHNVQFLPVSEVELLFLMPTVFKALAAELNFPPDKIEALLVSLKEQMFSLAKRDIAMITLKRAKKTIERDIIQSISSAKSPEDLTGPSATAVTQFDFVGIVNSTGTQLDEVINTGDYDTLLKIYGFKGALAEVGNILNLQGKKGVELQISMILAKGENTALHRELLNALPRFS